MIALPRNTLVLMHVIKFNQSHFTPHLFYGRSESLKGAHQITKRNQNTVIMDSEVKRDESNTHRVDMGATDVISY